MNYEDMTFEELEALLLEENKVIDDQRAKLGLIAHHRNIKAQENELSRKLGGLGDGELEMLRKLLSQTTSPVAIQSAEDIKV